MSPLLLCLVIFLMLTCTFTWGGQNFVNVKDCPKNANEWDFRSREKKCYGDTPDYLCAAIENKFDEFGEICTKYGLTPSNKCAVLNAQTKNLDSVDCKAASGCPAQPYIPSELWKYTICYGNFYGTKTTLAQNTIPTNTIEGSRSKDGDTVFGAGVAVAVVIILIIVVVVVVMVVFYKRNQFGFKDKVQPLLTDLRKRFHNSERREGHAVSDAERQLLKNDQPVYAKPDKNKTKKEQTDAAKPGKSETKTEKVANTTDTDDKKERGHRDKHDWTELNVKKLRELLKYLVHILKQELGVNDLQEKTVIHSKSIEEHFTAEPLRKELQSVKDLNDYDRLDISLVFALLRNFCDGIKPPSRGWDYEPPDDETHVGADIERIRSMWNKYCDHDLQLKYLDDVYNRMKQKYGTVAVHGDDAPPIDGENEEGFELMKDKIQSIKLNPDCTVEKGIVITENVTTALKILKSRNVVILKGAIGCGKTHALKAIQNHFQEKNWKTVWMNSEIGEGREISHEKKTILLSDNLFGKFGRSVFSQDDVSKTEIALKEIESSKQKTKVVIGIHTHVYDEVKKNLKLYFLQQKNITVEMDNLSAAEILLIFKEQHKRGHCIKDSNCWFKTVGFQSVLDKLSKYQGHIGGPFLSLMYCNQHQLFSDEAFSIKPFQTLMQYIEKIKRDSPKLYECLVYLMCVQQHNIDEEPKKWAGFISVEITKHNLMDLAKTSGLLQVENERVTLAHELLTTALFKSAAEIVHIFLPVLQVCDSDVFLQLLRPSNGSHSDLCYEFMCNFRENSIDERKMCAYRLTLIYTKQEIAHPLMAEELVKDKYVEYLRAKPKNLSLINF